MAVNQGHEAQHCIKHYVSRTRTARVGVTCAWTFTTYEQFTVNERSGEEVTVQPVTESFKTIVKGKEKYV